MPPEFEGLMEVYRWASLGGRVPKIGPEHPAFFYALRSSQHEDRDLVNMLLSDLSRMDFRQLFICHKPLFYTSYRNWPEPKKDYVAKFLSAEYAMDKVGAREALFGEEPRMEEPETLYSAEDYSETKKKKPVKSPWGVPFIKDGVVYVKPHDDDDNHPRQKKRGRSMREELDWDKKKYRGKKGRKR
jgi:hypothetical protein